jgi:hypothetical protein
MNIFCSFACQMSQSHAVDSTDSTSNQLPELYLTMLKQTSRKCALGYDVGFYQIQQSLPGRCRKVVYHLLSSTCFVGSFCAYGLIGAWYLVVPLCNFIVTVPIWIGTFVPNTLVQSVCSNICAKKQKTIIDDLVILSAMQFNSHVFLYLAWHAAKSAMRCTYSSAN